MALRSQTSKLNPFERALLRELASRWRLIARPNQLPPPGSWYIWVLLGGRGSGKTRAGAEFVRSRVESGEARRIAIVARSAADYRDVMIEGESGLLNLCWKEGFRPKFESSKRRLIWPNGAIAICYSAEEPDQLRGPQHDTAWCDELASWSRPEAFDNLLLGMRIGDPRVVVTTTPRPTKFVKDLVQVRSRVVVTRMSTYENLDNLAPAFRDEVLKRYEGTLLGRQELYGEIVEPVEGSLWNLKMLEDAYRPGESPEFSSIVVGVDPALTSKASSDETGIVVVGLGKDGLYYVLDDRSLRGTPARWGQEVVDAYHDWDANWVVVEVNSGGEMVRNLIETIDTSVALKEVRATRGKALRAEPVVSLYEQGKVVHTRRFPKLEEQMLFWIPGHSDFSPDRVDALVWAMQGLFDAAPRFRFKFLGNRDAVELLER